MKATGRPYHQHYLTHLVAADGKIGRLREFIDNVIVARALLPGGTADLTATA